MTNEEEKGNCHGTPMGAATGEGTLSGIWVIAT
jgi:hypothetical protein